MARRAIFVLTILSSAAALDECSGYTYSPYTCNQDDTHRVCAQLVDSTSTCDATSPSFWTVTDQESWATEVCDSPNSGTDWCICMWAYADYIAEEGCDALSIDCDATDVTCAFENVEASRALSFRARDR